MERERQRPPRLRTEGARHAAHAATSGDADDAVARSSHARAGGAGTEAKRAEVVRAGGVRAPSHMAPPDVAVVTVRVTDHGEPQGAGAQATPPKKEPSRAAGTKAAGTAKAPSRATGAKAVAPAKAPKARAGRRAGGGKAPARKRARQVIVRLTDDERDALRANASAAGLTVQGYVLQRAVYADDASELPTRQQLAAVRLELVRQGTNLNQIARRLNSAPGSPDAATAAAAGAAAERAARSIADLMGRLVDVLGDQ